MKRTILAGLALACAGGTAATAQTTIVWPASVSADGQARMTVFAQGTPIALRTRTQVSTKTNKPGDRLYLDVAETLSYRGQVVIPAGAVAVAEVARADRNGYFGKKGKLDIHLMYVETPNGPVRLSGTANDQGTSGMVTSIATIAFISPLGFLIHGTSATLPHGTAVQAYLAEPLRFMSRPTAQQTPDALVAPEAKVASVQAASR